MVQMSPNLWLTIFIFNLFIMLTMIMNCFKWKIIKKTKKNKMMTKKW